MSPNIQAMRVPCGDKIASPFMLSGGLAMA